MAISDFISQGLRSAANWFHAPEPVKEAEAPKAAPKVTVESDSDSDDEAEAAKEASHVRPAAAPKTAAPESLEDVKAKVDGIRDHFKNVVEPELNAYDASHKANSGNAAYAREMDGRKVEDSFKNANRSDMPDPSKVTEYEKVMKMKLHDGILSLRGQIEKIQVKAQEIVREAEGLKHQVTALDDKLNLITQLRSRLQMQANGRGELDLSQDRLTKQLFENAENLGVVPAKSIEGMEIMSKERRDGFVNALKDKAEEIKRARGDLNEQIQKKTKDAYKLVETYNECWKMLKKLIDDYYAILRKMAQAMNGAR